MKFIFVFAHPDDESFSSGGTIARLVEEGHVVTLITATKGEMGMTGLPPLCTQEKLGEVREKEHKDATDVLGISKIYYLGLIDGTLSEIDFKKIATQILEILKKETPDAVVTFDEEGYSRHPDHIQINKAATYAFNSYLVDQGKNICLYYTALPNSLLRQQEKGT